MSLEDRITRLEAIEAVRVRVLDFFNNCDSGGETGEAYSAAAMADMWTQDGSFQSGDLRLESRNNIAELFLDLAQTFCLHYAGNYIIDIHSDNGRAIGRWTAWESPILTGRPVWGCFSHDHVCVKCDDIWYWQEWAQTIHFFTPTSQSWVQEPLIVEQLRSRGA